MTTDEAERLLIARATLCDVLMGRQFRGYAEDMLELALDCERLGAPRKIVTGALERAAHWEWIAEKTERGHILWGGRLNRCGTAEEEER